MRHWDISLVAALSATVLCVSACNVRVETGPMQHDSVGFEKDAIKALRTELRMGAGTLRVNGGASKWMEGNFSYNVPSWKPDSRYQASGDHGEIVIEQPHTETVNMGSGTTNEWSLRLNNDVPLELVARLGAGEARFDLGTTNLRHVDIEMGAGQLHLDLRGKPKQGYEVRVSGGAGEATVYLPQDVGISATATGGLGEIQVKGLRKDGDHWVNDAWGGAKPQVRVDVRGGVGQINIIAE